MQMDRAGAEAHCGHARATPSLHAVTSRPLPIQRGRLSLAGVALVGACVLPRMAGADTPTVPLDLGVCRSIAGDTERLACYDRLAGRARSDTAQPATLSMPAPLPAAPTVSKDGAAAGSPATPVATPSGPGLMAGGSRGSGGGGLWSKFWELERADKRGTFNFLTYRPNFLLPVHYTSRINRSPTSPTPGREGSLPDYKRIEAKLQLSLRTKIVQSLLLPDADLWFGYTQQSLWQVWNKQDSAPFRSTDYEPELIYVLPVPRPYGELPGGWRLSMLQAALAHQSNGQTEPLSRSWNRVYVAAGLERGEYSLLGRFLRRLPEDRDDDDNPDLTSYRGRGDIALTWTPGRATASLLYRTTLRDLRRGALQFDWTYPVDSDKPDGLRWYVQVFTGYGETLLDYNFRQTSVGLGLTLFEF